MIQILDGTAQKMVELIITSDQVKILEENQQKSYSTQRHQMIRERKQKLNELTEYLYEWAVNTQHELIKEFTSQKMLEIGRLIHG